MTLREVFRYSYYGTGVPLDEQHTSTTQILHL